MVLGISVGLMRFACGVLLMLCLGSLLRAADDVKWGTPVNGLRIGIVNPPTSATSDQELTFKIVAENVSQQPITLPTPDTFMLKSDTRSNDYHESPLTPVVEKNKIGTAPIGPFSESSVSASGIPSDVAPKTMVTLAPGKSITWDSIPLKKFSYFGDHLPPGDKTDVQECILVPNFMFHIRFRFENQAKQMDGTNLWTGLADTGIADVEIKPPSTDDFKLTGGFTLSKPVYFVGEPIEATFTVTNTGTETIEFLTGSNNLGSSRFSFVATDEQGNTVRYPIPSNGLRGGFGNITRIAPGATYSETLLVNKWCAFSEPGKYKLVCKRTLNVFLSKNRNSPAYAKSEEGLPAIPIETTLDITLDDNPGAQTALIRTEVDTLLGNIPISNGGLSGLASNHLQSLVLAQTPATFPEIVRLLDGPAEVQAEAVLWISVYGYEKASPLLLDHAPRLSPRARILALRTLSQWNAPGVEPLVAAALSDSDPELRADAVLICVDRWYGTCVPILLKMETDLDTRVREYLGRALGVSGDPKAIPVLIQLLHDYDPDPHIKIEAAKGLGKFKRYEGVPVMIGLLNDPKVEVKDDVMDALTKLTGQKFDNQNAWLDWWEKTGKAQYGAGN